MSKKINGISNLTASRRPIVVLPAPISPTSTSMRHGLDSVIIVLGLDICSIVTWQDGFLRKVYLGPIFRILNPDLRADRLTQLRHNYTLAYVVGGCPNPLVRFLKVCIT